MYQILSNILEVSVLSQISTGFAHIVQCMISCVEGSARCQTPGAREGTQDEGHDRWTQSCVTTVTSVTTATTVSLRSDTQYMEGDTILPKNTSFEPSFSHPNKLSFVEKVFSPSSREVDGPWSSPSDLLACTEPSSSGLESPW